MIFQTRTIFPMCKQIPFLIVLFINGMFAHAQTNSIILGRPTDTSITVSILFDQSVDYYLEYGTQTGTYSNKTGTLTNKVNTPDEIDLHNLTPNTRYFYRVQFRRIGGSTFTPTAEFSFNTQRAKGTSFTFTIEADEHLYDKKGVKSIYQLCLNNQAKDKPDFMLSLGDIFGDDHNPWTITSAQLDALHKNYRPFLGSICHSVPFYVCLGNHEGENDYYLSKTAPDNLAVWGTQWRKFYYPNPFPNGFYSGNTVSEPFGIGYPENYYAWTWGDALFVVLDVYRDQCDTSEKPQNWDWSLGKPQYDWLKATLEGSSSKYKFVFAHHIRGQGRGGITNARLFEWGGYDGKNGTTYSFPTKRPGWSKPIHQLFKDNGVNIFFQGHDHVFAHEQMDGVTYQAVPMPSDSTYMIGKLANADAYTSDTLDGTGHIRVTVNPSCIKVDFVRAYLPKDTLSGIHKNGEVAFSYTIGNCSSVSVSEESLDNGVDILPNPANDKLTVRYKDDHKNYIIKLSNTLGETVLETRTNKFNVMHLPNGIYYLTIMAEKMYCVKKVIVNHN